MVSVDQINKNVSIGSLVTVWERGKLWTHKCTFYPWCTLVLWLDATEVTKSDSISISVGRLWREKSHSQDPYFFNMSQNWCLLNCNSGYQQTNASTRSGWASTIVPRHLGCRGCGEHARTKMHIHIATTIPMKSYHHLGLSPMRLNELWKSTFGNGQLQYAAASSFGGNTSRN